MIANVAEPEAFNDAVSSGVLVVIENDAEPEPEVIRDPTASAVKANEVVAVVVIPLTGAAVPVTVNVV